MVYDCDPCPHQEKDSSYSKQVTQNYYEERENISVHKEIRVLFISVSIH